MLNQLGETIKFWNNPLYFDVVWNYKVKICICLKVYLETIGVIFLIKNSYDDSECKVDRKNSNTYDKE